MAWTLQPPDPLEQRGPHLAWQVAMTIALIGVLNGLAYAVPHLGGGLIRDLLGEGPGAWAQVSAFAAVLVLVTPLAHVIRSRFPSAIPPHRRFGRSPRLRLEWWAPAIYVAFMAAFGVVEVWTTPHYDYPVSVILLTSLLLLSGDVFAEAAVEYYHGAREQRQWAVMERDRLRSFPPADRDAAALARADAVIRRWEETMAKEAAAYRAEGAAR